MTLAAARPTSICKHIDRHAHLIRNSVRYTHRLPILTYPELICTSTYQFIVIGCWDVGVSVGDKDQLTVRVDGEITEYLVLICSQKVSDGFGLGLRQSSRTVIDLWTAVPGDPDHYMNEDRWTRSWPDAFDSTVITVHQCRCKINSIGCMFCSW